MGLQARGVRSIDVGCMQINLMYHPAAFSSLEQAFDPFSNARYAATFLRRLFEQSASWQAAAAAYHSQTAPIGAEYAQRVALFWRPEQKEAPRLSPLQRAVGATAAFAAYRRELAARDGAQRIGSLWPTGSPPALPRRHFAGVAFVHLGIWEMFTSPWCHFSGTRSALPASRAPTGNELRSLRPR